MADLPRAPGDEGFGHSLGEKARRLRLKIDQLIDRSFDSDLALQRLESGMVRGDSNARGDTGMKPEPQR